MKHREEHARLAFDEQRAMEDLQNVQREIQRARAERERAEAEFDAFLRGFRTSRPVPAPRPRTPPAPEPPPDTRKPPVVQHDPPAAAERVPAPPVQGPTQASAPELEAPLVAEPVESQAKPRAAARPAAVNVRTAIAIAVAVLLVIAAVVVFQGGRTAPESTSTVPPATTPQAPPNPTTAPASSPAGQTEPAPALPTGGVNLEMITLRPVWVRVTLDGRRAIERELDEGQRIPLRAERSIVIRAGDAGAVAVRHQGRAEAPLGRDGVVATREYTLEGSRTPTPPR